MYARVTRSKQPPEEIDRTAGWVEDAILTRIKAQPGFVGLLDMYDRETGDGLTVTLWKSASARDESESMAADMRGEAESSFEAEIAGVERYEVTTHSV